MKKILVCQHVAHEILGTLNPLFKKSGFRIRYHNFGRKPDGRPSLEGYFGLVILGGPMNVDETDLYSHLEYEVQLIQEALNKKIPILGICLGAQLIAKALGAEVRANPIKEIGWYDLCLTKEGKTDPLLKHLGDTEKIFQWHGYTFEIPRNAVHLASSPTCPHQAFRYENNVYALQFHLEVDRPMIKRWLKVNQNKLELQASEGLFPPEKIAKDTLQYVARSLALSEKIFGEFVRLFGVSKKTQLLPSR